MSPLILAWNRPLLPSDGAYEISIEEWHGGVVTEFNRDIEVIPTQLEGAFARAANFSNSSLRFAKMKKLSAFGANFDSASLFGGDFENALMMRASLTNAIAQEASFIGANLSYVRLSNAELQRADMSDANLNNTSFDTNKIWDLKWADDFMLPQERDREFDIAIPIYVELSRAHNSAGDHRSAGTFHYRAEVSNRKALAQVISGYYQNTPNTPSIRALINGILKNPHLLLRLLAACGAEFVFGYGERPFRVLRMALLVLFTMAFLYMDQTNWQMTFDGIGRFFSEYIESLYFSAVSFTALGYGEWIEPPSGWTKYLGVLESAIGVPLLSLFLITLLRRWIRG